MIPNRYINIIPNQKEGIEINKLKIDSPIFLILLLLVLCKKNDKGIDTKKIMNMEIKAILSVKGSLSKINLNTGSLYLKEIPKSPWKTPQSQFQYLVPKLRFNPNCSLKFSRSLALASSPKIVVSGSPGINSKSKKEKVPMEKILKSILKIFFI